MKKFFSTEGPFSQCMGRMFDLIVLNCLLIICSVPIVTMGAAITAVYDMSLRMQRKEEDSVVRGFFRGFKNNFRDATVIWLLFLFIAAVSFGDVMAGEILAAYGLQFPLMLIGGIQIVLALSLLPFLFALTARFENTLAGTLKNAFLMAVTHLGATLRMLLVGTSGIWIFLWVPMPVKIFYCFVSMLLMFWFALCIHYNGIQLHKIFQLHFRSEEPEEEQEI
ncbi:MAG: YesL family protein [Lachnospiraceae bacterium]|nr:YesL family protein [Lachnospiraceae bacterium]